MSRSSFTQIMSGLTFWGGGGWEEEDQGVSRRDLQGPSPATISRDRWHRAELHCMPGWTWCCICSECWETKGSPAPRPALSHREIAQGLLQMLSFCEPWGWGAGCCLEAELVGSSGWSWAKQVEVALCSVTEGCTVPLTRAQLGPSSSQTWTGSMMHLQASPSPSFQLPEVGVAPRSCALSPFQRAGTDTGELSETPNSPVPLPEQGNRQPCIHAEMQISLSYSRVQPLFHLQLREDTWSLWNPAVHPWNLSFLGVPQTVRVKMSHYLETQSKGFTLLLWSDIGDIRELSVDPTSSLGGSGFCWGAADGERESPLPSCQHSPISCGACLQSGFSLAPAHAAVGTCWFVAQTWTRRGGSPVLHARSWCSTHLAQRMSDLWRKRRGTPEIQGNYKRPLTDSVFSGWRLNWELCLL